MSLLTFNTYPQGHYHHVYPERLYSSGQRIVEIFLDNNLVGQGEYSLLVYSPDRVKIEIKAKKELNLNSFRTIMNRERDQCTINCWEETESDKMENLLDKCKATELRETLLEGRHPSELMEGEWTEGINHVIQSYVRGEIRLSKSDYGYFNREFLHLIMNPIGYTTESRVRDRINVPRAIQGSRMD